MTKNSVLVIGGAGYVGSALVPSLLKKGYNVSVFDTFWYGDVFKDVKSDKLKQISGDIRDKDDLFNAVKGIDKVIHLACISNDPSYYLNPDLGEEINYKAFFNVIDSCRAGAISRFIYASSSSIYGVKEDKNVVEDSIPNPLTDYSKYKLACEDVLRNQADSFPWIIIRPATVCGYAPRLRLDVVVNILTINALEKGIIKITGTGKQLRPNINIKDMVRAYESLLESSDDKVLHETFNAGYENHTVEEIGRTVQRVIPHAKLIHEPTDDNRSYHINSDKIKRKVGFIPQYTIEDAVESLVEAHRGGKIIDGLNNPFYYNIKRMQELKVQKRD